MPTQNSSFDESEITAADQAFRSAITRIAADQVTDVRAASLLREVSSSQALVIAVGDQPVRDLMERVRPLLEEGDLLSAWTVIAPPSSSLTLRRYLEHAPIEWAAPEPAPMAEPAGDIVERDD